MESPLGGMVGFVLLLSFGSPAVAAADDAAQTGARSPPPAAVRRTDGYLKLDFEQLASYPLAPPAFRPGADLAEQRRRAEDQLPAGVKAWHGEKVVVTGYMVPTKLEQGRVKELMLMRHAFAAGNVSDPWINEWVLVRVRAGVPAQTRQPVSFFGVMKVGAVFEQGYMIGIYVLEAERMGENGF